MTDAFDIKGYITEQHSVLNEDNDWQDVRREILGAANGLVHRIDNGNSPAELGDAGYDPKKEKAAITKTRKFLAKIERLEDEWVALSRGF